MDAAGNLHESLKAFAILEEDAWDVRAWIKETTSLDALEAFYEVCGESELQLAHICHLVEERVKELNDS